MKCLASCGYSKNVYSFPSFLGVWGCKSQERGLEEQPVNLGTESKEHGSDRNTYWTDQAVCSMSAPSITRSQAVLHKVEEWFSKGLGDVPPHHGLLGPEISSCSFPEWFFLPTQTHEDCTHNQSSDLASKGRQVRSPQTLTESKALWVLWVICLHFSFWPMGVSFEPYLSELVCLSEVC